MIDFAEKHLKANNMGTEEPKVWIDESHAMAVKTDRSGIINVLRNYEQADIDQYNQSIKVVKSMTTAKSTFGIKYMKDILKLMTKVEKDAETITIEIGNDTIAVFRLNDSKGDVLEVELAPRKRDK